MSRTVNIQTDFTAGVIDPKLRARLDLDQYYKGLKTGTNIIVQPQGGFKRRPGLQYVDTISGGTPASGVRLVSFEFSTSDSYMLLFVNNRMYVYKNKVLQTDINSVTGRDYLDTDAQKTMTVSSVSGTFQKGETVTGGTSGATGECLTVPGSTMLVRDISGTFSASETITGGTSSATCTMDSIADTVVDGIASARLANMRWVQSADTLIVVEEDMAVKKIVRGASDSDWTISDATYDFTPQYAFTLSTSNPSATLTPSAVDGNITLTAGSSVFSSSDVNQYVNNTANFGRARIVEYVSGTSVKAYVETPFFDTSAISSGNWELESGYEDAWSSSKGYPRSVTFHEGRLYFGGSKNLPSTVWGSRVNDFFNFDPGEGLDDEAVQATIDTNQLNSVTEVYSGRDLQFLTTGGEFYVPQTTLEPITPSNFVVRLASRFGTKEGVGVMGLDSGTLYIQRQGRALNEFIYTEADQAYVSSRVSVLSSHLLTSPTRMDLRRSTATDEGDLLLIVNGTEGTMAAYSLLRSQNVVAASQLTTDGSFVDVAVDIDTIYAVVKRTINSVDTYLLEVFNEDYTTDSAVQGGVASSISSNHLVSEEVKLLLDGAVQADQTMDGSGNLTFPRASTTSYELGLNYTVTVETMPVDPRQAGGTRQGFKRRVLRIDAICHETQSLTINSTEVPFRELDVMSLDTAVQDFTGIKTLHAIQGFSQDATVSIGQTTPLKMTVLGLEYRVSAGG